MKLVLATYHNGSHKSTLSEIENYKIHNVIDLLANLDKLNECIDEMFSDEESGIVTEIYGIVKGKRFMTLEEAIEDYVETYGFNAKLARLGF